MTPEEIAMGIGAKAAASKFLAVAPFVGVGLVGAGASGVIDNSTGIALGVVVSIGAAIWTARGVYDRLGTVEAEVKELKRRVRAEPCDKCGHIHDHEI